MKIGLFVAAQYPPDASAATGIDAHLAHKEKEIMTV